MRRPRDGATHDGAAKTGSSLSQHASFHAGYGADAQTYTSPAPPDVDAPVARGGGHAGPPPALALPGASRADCVGCHPGFHVDCVAPALHINGRIDRQ